MPITTSNKVGAVYSQQSLQEMLANLPGKPMRTVIWTDSCMPITITNKVGTISSQQSLQMLGSLPKNPLLLSTVTQ